MIISIVIISLIISFLGIYISKFFLEKNEYKPSAFNLFVYFLLVFFTLIKIKNSYSIIPPICLLLSLIICCETDLAIMMIPTVVTVAGQIVAPILCYFTSWLLLPRQSLIAGIGAWLVMWAISKFFFKIKKKEGLGLGDADIIALIAAYVGLVASIRIIFMACLMGLCFIAASYVTTKKIITKLPFGPLLSLACVLQLCFPHMFKIVLGW
jgi:prepilin signal peptidase PulO-like enzyme (type II secretory pathway)